MDVLIQLVLGISVAGAVLAWAKDRSELAVAFGVVAAAMMLYGYYSFDPGV